MATKQKEEKKTDEVTLRRLDADGGEVVVSKRQAERMLSVQAKMKKKVYERVETNAGSDENNGIVESAEK